MFGKVRDSISKRVACLVYKQTIAPVLEYCGYIYNGLTCAHQKKLQRIQNRCLRVCLKVRLKHNILDLHSGTTVKFLGVRYDMQLLTLIHKYVYGGKHDPHSTGIMPKAAPISGRTTRSTGTMELVYPDYNKLGSRKSPLFRGVDLWNRLSPTCRLDINIDSFKQSAEKAVMTWYMSRWYPGETARA